MILIDVVRVNAMHPIRLSGVLVVCFLLNVVRGGCPSGWERWSGSCYLLQPTAVEQSAAVALCGLHNSTLVSVATALEASALEQMMTAAGVTDKGQPVKYWTGLDAASHWADGTAFNKSIVSVVRQPSSLPCSTWNSVTQEIRFQSCADQNRPFCKRTADIEYVDKCNSEDGWQDISGSCYKLSDVSSSWNDSQRQCLRQNGNLFVPGSSPYVIDRLVSCRISVSHIWLGVSDTTHAGTLMAINSNQPAVIPTPGDGTIIEPGNTCLEVVTTTSNLLRYETDTCQGEKQFICQKPYGTCPAGWAEHKGRCYQVNAAPEALTTWFLAKQRCRDEGADMLIVNDLDEDTFISQLIKQSHILQIWLGFSDEMVPDKLQWVDGSLAYGDGTSWGDWQHNYPAPVSGRTDCGIMTIGSGSGTWTDGYCYNTKSFVCELHVGKPLTPKTSVWANYTCDDSGWAAFRDQCYLFGNDQTTWDNASQICSNQGGHLASPQDFYAQSYLTMQLPDTGKAWIGLKRDSANGKYYWTDHTEANFTNYLPGNGTGFDCMEMVTEGSLSYPGGWTDHNCSQPQDYICQRPADPNGMATPTPTYAWSTRCEPGWRLNSQDDVCYLVMMGTPKIWTEASYDCIRRGGHLLSVSGPNEQLHIEAVLRTSFPQLQSLWIGASDSTREGGWEWSDQAPFRYLHWYPGEPNAYTAGEDCAEMAIHWGYQWNDRRCDSILDYICKKPATPPASSPTPAVPTVPPGATCEMDAIISGTYSIQSTFAFTSSSNYNNSYGPENLRLLDSNLWSWRPLQDQAGEWVEVTFYQVMAIDGLTISGQQNSFNYVSNFSIQYQYNLHSAWYWIESAPGVHKIFEGVDMDAQSNSVYFLNTIHAQSIRLYPVNWGTHIAVRFELSGCIFEACASDYAVSGPLVVMEGDLAASSMSDPDHSPNHCRLHAVAANTPTTCWRPLTPLDPSHPPWIEVNLGTIKLLRGVTVMGNPDADEYVTLFQLQYRLNMGSGSFLEYQEPYGIPMNFSGNADHNGTVTHLLKSVVTVQHVRILVLEAHGYPALRFDLLVCSFATCHDIPLLSGRHNVSGSAFSASSSRDPQHGPQRSRLGMHASGALGGAWAAKFNDVHQYLQVDLGEQIRVWAVATQGDEQLSQFVNAYTLAFSTDAKTFSTYSGDGTQTKTFDGNFDATSVRKHYLMRATVARYVQLWPVDYDGAIALRWEIYGCPGPEAKEFVGCFLDEASQRDLPFEPLLDIYAHIAPLPCLYHCFDKGYAYAGVQRGIACYCGNSYGKYGASLNTCNSPCLAPYEKETCGGHMSNSVYTTGLAAPDYYCQNGWEKRDGQCYLLEGGAKSWFDSHEECRRMGGELASVSGRAENDFIFSRMASGAAGGTPNSMWIGLNDIQETYFYQWNDGSQVTFTNWDLHMPVTNPAHEQHCVALNNQTGGWKTTFCEETMRYICKAPMKPSPIPHLPPLSAGCQTAGWQGFKGSCYHVVAELRSWQDASTACLAMGATLVRIGDRYEEAFVSSMLGDLTGFYWTDVTDLTTFNSFRFSDKSPVVFTSWGAQQPPRELGGGRCVGLHAGQDTGLWFKEDCQTKSKAMCEKPQAGFVPKPTQPMVPPGARCPQGWWEAVYSCFQVNLKTAGKQLSWDEAREDCQAQGAELASFHAHDDLQSLWKNQLAGNNANFWIGLRYSVQAQAIQWNDGAGVNCLQWAAGNTAALQGLGNSLEWSDGSAVNFLQWAAGESSALEGLMNCGEVEAMQWSDGSAVNFLQWAAGESSALEGLMNCGEVRVGTGDMAHQSCFARRNWVCSIARGNVPIPRTTVILPYAGNQGHCRPLGDQWMEWQGACYSVIPGDSDHAMTWREGRLYCNSLHADLVSITSPQEQLFVQSLATNASALGLWIGLNKLDVGHGFKWSDGSPTSYENWDVGEPNNFGYLEYCGDFLPRNGKWNDEVCTRKRGFVCKQTNGSAHNTTPTPTPALTGFCPAGYSQMGSKCFRVFGDGKGQPYLTWSKAWDFCSSFGPRYTLATIASTQENLFIVTLMGDNQLAAWFGLRRLPDGAFIWADNSAVKFSNWDDGEPTGGVQSCVYMKGSSSAAGLWDDAPCAQTANYICMTHIDPSIATPEPIPNPCDAQQGFTPFQTGCYKYMTTPADWAGAGAACHAVGAHLPTLHDAFGQAFLQLFVAKHAATGQAPSVWIGLSDLQAKGSYAWTLGWPMTFSNWAEGEPARGAGEGCVRMGSDGLWVDDDCSQQLPYVCLILNENFTTYTPQPPTGQCAGPGWFAYGDFCYLFHGDDPRTFYSAQLYCQEHGAHLTSVHHNTTSDFLVSMVISQTEYNVWIGLYASQTAGFSWLDLTVVDYTQWAPSQPSQTDAQGVPQHCVAMDARTERWDDLDCDLHLGYICRKPQELDDSSKTRPPVIPPQKTPPSIPGVSQKTPAILPGTPSTTPSHQPGAHSTLTPPTPQGASSSSSPAGRHTNPPGSQTSRPTPTPSHHTAHGQGQGQGQTDSSSGLDSGGVAAVVLSLLAVTLVGAYAWFFVRRRRGGRERMEGDTDFSNILYNMEQNRNESDSASAQAPEIDMDEIRVTGAPDSSDGSDA